MTSCCCLKEDLGEETHLCALPADRPMEDAVVRVPLWRSHRLGLAVWAFFGLTAIYAMRYSFSVAIVCMTYDEWDNSTYNASLDKHHDPMERYMRGLAKVDNDVKNECGPGILPFNGTGTFNYVGEFAWSRELRGTISSSFFWGYITTQFAGGLMSQRYGGKRIVAGGMIISMISMFLSPVAARFSPYALMAMRVLNGLGQGVFFPGIYCMFGKWAPMSDRSLLNAVFGAGSGLGSVLSFAVSGIVCSSLGWDWIFYIYGILTFVWVVCWCLFVYENPSDHPWITGDEKDYINKELAGSQPAACSDIPWKKVLLSRPLWVLMLNEFCLDWTNVAGNTQLPQYMEDVLRLGIKENGLYTALPHVAKVFSGIMFAVIADQVINGKCCSVTRLRKTMHTIATIFPAACLISLGYLDCRTAFLAIFILVLEDCFQSAGRAGAAVSRVDIAPRFSGIVLGFCNTAGNLAGIIAPCVIGIITKDGTRRQWQFCFYLSAGFYFLSWINFILFGTSIEQEWAKNDSLIANEEQIDLSSNVTEKKSPDDIEVNIPVAGEKPPIPE